MFVSTINVISQSGQAYSHKNVGPGRAPGFLRGPVCREPEQSRAMGNSCLPAAAEKGAQPFQRVGVRLVRIGDHLALKPAISSRPLRPSSSIRLIWSAVNTASSPEPCTSTNSPRSVITRFISTSASLSST